MSRITKQLATTLGTLLILSVLVLGVSKVSDAIQTGGAGHDNNAVFLNDVGIGTMDPTEKLHVDGNIHATGIYTGDGSGLTGVSFDGDVAEIYNSLGNLKIMPDVQGDVVLFGDTQVGDATDGKELKIHRKAAEGNSYIRFYIVKGDNAMIHSDEAILIQNASGKNIQLNSGQHVYLNLGDQAGSDEVRIRDSGGLEVGTVDSNGNAWYRGDLSIGVSSDVLIQADGDTYFNGGDVGIGGLVANSKFSIQGSESGEHSNAAGMAMNNTATGGDTWYLRTGADGTTTPAGGFSIADTTSYRLVIDENGNVGIGTMTPTKKLQVNGDALINGELETDDGIIVGGNIQVTGTVDGRDIATDGTKLDGIATGAEVATKEFFLSAGEAILNNNCYYDTPNNTYQVSMSDGVTYARCSFVFHLPSDFSSMASGYPKVVFQQGTGGTGNYRIAFNGRAGGVGESMGDALDSIAEYTMAAPGATTLWEEDISANFDGLSLVAGDSVGLQIQRDSDDANDTFAGDLDVVGVIIKY